MRALPVSAIYLDYNATTPVHPLVREAMLGALDEVFANPASAYAAGGTARAAIERARGQVAALLGARPAEIVFTSGGTEANNLALLGALRAHGLARAHVVTSAIEHPAVLEPLRALEREGLALTLVAPDADGVVAAESVIAALRPETVLVSLMLANNEVGTLQPVAEVARQAKARGVLVHTDAAQAVGKIPIDVDQLGADLLSLAGHKLYAPKGIGALWVRPGTPLAPILFGGGQEGGLRPGTEPLPGIVALGAACAVAAPEGLAGAARLTRLRDRLEHQLSARIDGLQVNGQDAPRLPATAHVSILGVDGATLLAAVPELAASTGSACHTGHASPVLAAMGLSPAAARGAIRLSLGLPTTDAEIDRVVVLLAEAANRLVLTSRSASPAESR